MSHTDYGYNWNNVVRGPSGIRAKPKQVTQYMEMLLDLDSVPTWHNLAIALATWLLLAGFVVFPGSFTSIVSLDTGVEGVNGVESWLLSRAKNLGLLAVATICCIVGAIGMIGFWWRWRNNYIWITTRIFMPGTLHSLAGMLSTIINVCTAQSKEWSVTAQVSVSVEAVCLAVCGSLFLFYSNLKLNEVKRQHDMQVREYDAGY